MSQQEKITQLKTHLQTFLEQLDSLDPSETSVEDIDRLIHMIEDMEKELH